MSKRLLVSALCLLMAGCSVFKPSHKPVRPAMEAFSSSGSLEVPNRWWQAFESTELNSLIDQAFAGNLTLRQAWHRLEQLEAQARQAGAPLSPTLDGTGSASRNRSVMNKPVATGSTVTERTATLVKDYGLGLTTSYELDLWGRVRSGRNAAQARAAASQKDLESTGLTLAATITDRWLKLVEQRAQLALLREQVKTNKTVVELLELRRRKSIASAVDVYQQQQILAATEAQIPLVEAQARLLLHELALLTGAEPLSLPTVKTQTFPAMPERPALGVPADLLTRRPDLRASALRLEQAEWNVASARADRLPSLRLSGTAFFDADSTGKMHTTFENWYLNLAANLTAPIWDGRRRASEVQRLLALAREQLASYREAVLTALKEVEDALVREAKQDEHLAALRKELDFARKALAKSRDRYTNGASDYLPVLQALSTIQRLERTLLQRERERLIYRVNLYRALGSQWLPDPELSTDIPGMPEGDDPL